MMITGLEAVLKLGWLLRKDFQKSKARFEIKPRPEIRNIRQLFLRVNVDYYNNQAGQLESRNQDVTFDSLFQSGDAGKLCMGLDSNPVYVQSEPKTFG